MPGRRVRTQFQHVGQGDDPAPDGTARAQGGDRRGHGDRAGVVALVDDGEDPAGTRDRDFGPASGQGLER